MSHDEFGTNMYGVQCSILQPLVLPDYGEFGIEDPTRGTVQASDATHLGYFF